MGPGPASGLARGAGVLPTGSRRRPRPQSPVVGVPEPSRRGCREPGGGPPRRDAKQPPSPPRTPQRSLATLRSAAHLPRGRWEGFVAERSCRGRRGPAGRAPRAPGPCPCSRPAPSQCLRPPPSPGSQVWSPSPPGSCSGLALRRQASPNAQRGTETFPRVLPGRGAQRTWGLPGARGGGEPARRSRPESRAPRPGPCRRRHLPDCQLGMRGGPAPGPDINNPGEGGGWRGGEDALRCGEPRRPGEGRAAGAVAGGVAKREGRSRSQLGPQTHTWGEVQSSLVGPTAERLCFPSPSALHHPSVSRTLSLGLGFRLSVKPWTLPCTWWGRTGWRVVLRDPCEARTQCH